ncbi:hypothetical protein [Moheibacter stercoris]|uniref:Uncharacterized protein n=1 Tax=Moheibacter stercoris TaxID=1628251 RepID=A0ABV2LPY6_9FLAO
MSGLTQVRNLLHMRKNTDFKDYRFIEDIAMSVINDLLRGKIITLRKLEEEKFKILEYNYVNIIVF